VHEQPFAESEAPADYGAALARHDVRADLRELPFLVVGKPSVELACDRKAQDAVSEELEPLVGLRAILGPGGMRKGVTETRLRKRVDQREQLGLGLGTYWCDEM